MYSLITKQLEYPKSKLLLLRERGLTRWAGQHAGWGTYFQNQSSYRRAAEGRKRKVGRPYLYFKYDLNRDLKYFNIPPYTRTTTASQGAAQADGPGFTLAVALTLRSILQKQDYGTADKDL